MPDMETIISNILGLDKDGRPSKYMHLTIIQKTYEMYADLMKAMMSENDDDIRIFIEGLTDNQLRATAIATEIWSETLSMLSGSLHQEAHRRGVLGAFSTDDVIDQFEYVNHSENDE